MMSSAPTQPTISTASFKRPPRDHGPSAARIMPLSAGARRRAYFAMQSTLCYGSRDSRLREAPVEGTSDSESGFARRLPRTLAIWLLVSVALYVGYWLLLLASGPGFRLDGVVAALWHLARYYFPII